VPLGVAAWAGNEILRLTDIQFLYAAGLTLLSSIGTFVATSLMTAPPDDGQVDCCTRAFLPGRETPGLAVPWSAAETAAAVLLVVFTAALVAWWR
jgi:hypothetical protein